MRLLATTWQAHPADDEVRASGMADNLRHNTVANIAECERLVPHCLPRDAWERLDALLRGWFLANNNVFEARVKQDRIRDGHGDLKPSNIAFIDGRPVVTDCIEFNPQFRRLDTLAEAGFLATGMEQMGEFALATEVLRAYREAAQDDYPERLRRYYQAHLACVMGKVTALQLDDREIAEDQRARAIALARHNFALADFHAREPHVLMVAGVIGSGKSTVANELSKHFGWPVVCSDVERKRLLGVDPTRRLPAGAYNHKVSAQVYRELFNAIESAGSGVILDAQFPIPEFRRQALESARAVGGTVTAVLCDAPDNVLRERLRKRALDPSRVSDAGEELLEQSRAEFVPIGEQEGFEVIRVDERHDEAAIIASVQGTLLGTDFRPEIV
jgi:predicted kinase